MIVVGIIIFGVPLLCALVVALGWCFEWREKSLDRQYRSGCCARCGYDVRTNAGRCPECGEDLLRQAVAFWSRKM
jgi:predicted amidophosphoribosyltransferase